MDHSVEELKLSNGAKGLLIHVPYVKIMTFQLEFRAGEYLVTKDKWETPHLLEHMLFGANEQYPNTKLFQAEIEKNGAYSSASTGVYDIIYEAECADFEWDRILDLMILAVTKPLFLQKEFDAEFGNVYEELTGRTHENFRYLTLKLREKYGLIAKTDAERIELMRNVHLADVKAHYHKTHTASNLRFVIAGDLTPLRRNSITEMLRSIDLSTGSGRLELPDERPVKPRRPVSILSKRFENICFHIDIFMNGRFTSEERTAVSLANTMLTETLYSKIFGAAREQGLVYDIYSGYGENKSSSNWWFESQVSQANALALFTIIAKQLHEILTGKIADQDLEAAKSYALGRFQRGAQTVRGISDTYSGKYYFDGTIDDYSRIPERIKATTKTSIINAARQLFADKIWGLGTLSNCESTFITKLYDQLAPLWDKYY